MDPAAIRLRPATRDDIEFLHVLHRAAMQEHVEKTWGAPWDDPAQRKRFRDSTDPTTHDIVEHEGAPIGCRWVRRHTDALELVRLYLMPAAQGQGIGTHLVKTLLEEASGAGLRVRLRVMRSNPARRLYERLGFFVTADTDTHLAMEALPGSDT